MREEMVVVLDFGGQYNQLIARRVRECGVYCEIHSYKANLEDIRALHPKGIIFTGGPNSCYDAEAPSISKEIFDWGIPILGICYGAQLMNHLLGGVVCKAPTREYGKTSVSFDIGTRLFASTPDSSICWMSHNDYIAQMAPGFVGTAHTEDCPYAAGQDEERGLYFLQFHPEVLHTQYGKQILENFVKGICGLQGTWQMDAFIEEAITSIRTRVGDKNVLLGLSGGVDSSVAAVLISKAIGKQLTCVFVDQGLLRKNEAEEVEAVFGPEGPYQLQFVHVDARERFYKKLKGVTDPVEKRDIIGEEFIRVFEEEARRLGKLDYFAQGTIYPDVVESGEGGESSVIKPHHNVGALPEKIDFLGIVEPLRDLFKDEVRQVGLKLGIPERFVYRQPFPGPGLGVRIIGDITEEKVKIVQEADAIWREEIAKAGWDKKVDQYYAALSNMRTIGVMGDEKTYDYAIVLRAVTTVDFMTAESAEIPWEVIGTTTSRIVNEVPHVNRVLYDCTGKPPATIELE